MTAIVRGMSLAGVLVFAAGGAGLWLLPVEVFQRRAIERAPFNAYARWEAAGQTEFLVWVGRGGLPLLAAASLLILRRSAQAGAWLRAVGRDLAEIAAAEAPQHRRDAAPPAVRLVGMRRWLLGSFTAAWLGLFFLHAWEGLKDRGRDWAYFRFRSGEEVLPNISFENRDVIRYLQSRTPENARLFAYSDQRLFFLSYYLRPRRLFLRLHPEAQFVIPQPGQQRPSPAYRRGDLPPAVEQRVHPDYVLEYFEGPAYLDVSRLGEDRAWVEFWRRSHGERGLPPFLVVLTPTPTERLP